MKGLQFSNEKKTMDEQHSSLYSDRTMTFEQWCRQKEMMQRLKDKLVEDAKLEILEQRKEQEMNDTKQTQNWEVFSKCSYYNFFYETVTLAFYLMLFLRKLVSSER